MPESLEMKLCSSGVDRFRFFCLFTVSCTKNSRYLLPCNATKEGCDAETLTIAGILLEFHRLGLSSEGDLGGQHRFKLQ